MASARKSKAWRTSALPRISRCTASQQGSGGIFELYEMVPGVLLSALAIWVVSSLDRKSEKAARFR